MPRIARFVRELRRRSRLPRPRGRKIAIADDASVTAAVGTGAVAVGYGLEVELKVQLPGMDRETAQELVAGAHERCPYSNATRGQADGGLTTRHGQLV